VQLEYDLTVDALYIQLSEMEIARTRAVDRNTNVDLDENGVVVGIEVIDFTLPWPLGPILEDFTLPEGEAQNLIGYFAFVSSGPLIAASSPPPARELAESTAA
jgi:uncharacterized protein YuzE